MRNIFSLARAYSVRSLFSAGIVLAMALTLSCSTDDNGGSNDPSDGRVSSSSGGSSSSSRLSSSSALSSSGTTSSSSSQPLSSSQAIVPVYGNPIVDARDGQTYETVIIGTQTWMAKNLNYEAEGSKCYNDNNLNCTLYGRLYDWETAKNVCPSGWRLPSNFEWIVLEDFIGGEEEDAWKKLRAKSAGGTDDYGFNALSGGGGSSTNYLGVSACGYWWGSTSNRNRKGFCTGVGGFADTYLSVRCLKGDDYYIPIKSSSSYNPVNCTNVPSGGFCDYRDGKGYKSVTIDGKTWMAENLNFNAEGSKCYGEDGYVMVSGEGNKTLSNAEIQANCSKYGRLYDWSTVMAFESFCNIDRVDCSSYVAERHKGICPDGWHVPSDTEFQGLITSAGGQGTAGQILKATSDWTNPGADLLGFSALPSGSGGSDGNGGYIYVVLNGPAGEVIHMYGSSNGSDYSGKKYQASFLYMNGGSNSTSLFTDATKSGLKSLRCVKDE